jgi:hypothetical protein
MVAEHPGDDHDERDERDANRQLAPRRLAVLRSTPFVLALSGTTGCAETDRLIDRPDLLNLLHKVIASCTRRASVLLGVIIDLSKIADREMLVTNKAGGGLLQDNLTNSVHRRIVEV